MKLIKETKTRIVYQLPDISLINDKFLKKFTLHLKKNGAVITFEKKIKDEFKIISKISTKYHIGLIYSADKDQIFCSQGYLPDKLKIFHFKNEKEFKKYYYLQFLAFYKNWKKHLTQKYLQDASYAVNNLLKETRYLCLTENKTHAAFLSLIKWKDYLDNPVDWIAHVWIDGALEAELRNIIHKYFLFWLSKNMCENKVQAAVHSFNIRSQKFFRKMGFEPECIHILKSR